MTQKAAAFYYRDRARDPKADNHANVENVQMRAKHNGKGKEKRRRMEHGAMDGREERERESGQILRAETRNMYRQGPRDASSLARKMSHVLILTCVH